MTRSKPTQTTPPRPTPSDRRRLEAVIRTKPVRGIVTK